MTFAVVPFPQVPDAVRAGRITAGAAVDAFAMGAIAQGDLKALFTSKTGMPFDEELIVIIARPSTLKQYPAAVKAFLADLVAVTAYYQSHLREARQALLDAKLVGLPPQVYFNVPDYVRDPGLRPNLENMTKQQQVLVSSGFPGEERGSQGDRRSVLSACQLMSPPIIQASGLGKRFSRAGKEIEALRGFDLDVAEGEFIAIVGPSGCGKSTFLHMLGGFEPVSEGAVAVQRAPGHGAGAGSRRGVPGICALSVAHGRAQRHLGPGGAGKEPGGAARDRGPAARQGRADAVSRSLSGGTVRRHETAGGDRAHARRSIRAFC